MKKFSAVLAILLCAALLVPPGSSQEREDRTLLNWDQMRAIINEASGDRAVHTVLELVPYARVRNRAEYEGNFRESVVMASQAKEAGYSNVEIESFPSNARIWHASQAELWMTAPQLRKLYDVYDIGVAVCSGSETGDITADVVDVGIGARAEDYANKDVAGKIVLGSASSNVLQRLAVFDRGAVGVLSYDALRQDQYIDQLLTQSISTNAPQGKKPGFGWSISVRTARDISARLGRGVKVTMRSVIKSETFPGELETVHAVIPGDGSTTQEVIVSAHLYEGYQKQGANDDNSGCAMTLEAGRAYLRLVKDGFLPKPKRTIHFLWVPEISGTIAWLNKHQDIKNRLIADLNFDMEGLGLRMSGATWILHRTPDSFPSFLNDLCASVLEFVANLNRERVRYRLNGYGFTWPVVSQNGSWDPFYVTLEKYYGASDHAVYLQQGIPAVIFNTWPDPFYHSSFDTPDKMDPTQFKRAAVVATAAMTILATAGDEMAARVSAESLARGTERMGQAQRKGLSYLADAGEGASLPDAFSEARNAVRHQAEIEKAVVRSSSVLYDAPAEAEKKLAEFESLIDQRTEALQSEVHSYFAMRAEQRKVQAEAPGPSELETQAGRKIPERITPAGGGAGGGFGAMQAALQRLGPEERASVTAGMNKVPQHMSAEVTALVAQNPAKKWTILSIRDFVSGEFEPLPLADLMAYFQAAEKIGVVKLNEVQEEAKPTKQTKKKAPSKPKKKKKR